MNVVTVLVDSLNRRHLGAYGDSLGTTPELDAFARRAWRFDNHFVGSLPCMPARRELLGGFRELLWRPWGPLEPWDARLPLRLAGHGYRTAVVTDHYHYWEEPGNGYLQGFESVEIVRGQETDAWRPAPRPGVELPAWVERIEHWRPGEGRSYYANVRELASEEEFFPARVMSAAARWLERHASDEPFWLHVESFDVHEPFHVPEPYASMYGDPADNDRFTIWPPYQDAEALARFLAGATDAELTHIRSQYRGKLAMVDRWFGELTAALDRLGLWEDTVVLVTTDHGHDLAERGAFGKEHPHLDSHANIPLLLWHPEHPGDGRPVTALTSTVDLFATVLDAAGARPDERTLGRSVLPLVAEPRAQGREALLYGTFGQGACCTDGEWTLLRSPVADAPLFSYSSLQFRSQNADSLQPPVGQGFFVPGVHLPQWQVPVAVRPRSRETLLFNRAEDPEQRENRFASEPGQRRRMLELLRTLAEQEGAPAETYSRLGL